MKKYFLNLRTHYVALPSFFSLMIGFASLTGLVSIHAGPPSSQNREEIEKIERRLSEEKDHLRKLGSQEKGLLADLGRIEKEVAEKRRDIDKLNQKLHQAIAQSNVLKQNLSELKQLFMDSQNKISRRLVDFYKRSRTGYLKTFANVTDILDFLRRVKYFSLVIAEDRAALLRAAEKAQTYQDKIDMTGARLREIKEISRGEESRLALLNKELEEKVLLLVTLHQEKKFYETAVQELETAAEGLKQTLVDIEKNDTYKTDQPCHFADFKGKLPYPMNGKVFQAQALPEWEKIGTSKGIVIEGPANSYVKAVFQGKVAFSGGLKGYGEIVIIHHGSRFFTILANLSERTKMEGDVVQEGEVVGRVGANGVQTAGRLYFEIRRAGKGLDPQEWLKSQ